MTDQHPITPPPELVQQWFADWDNTQNDNYYRDYESHIYVATQAAQWGADQELEACAKWVGCMFHGHKTWSDELRADRRPKPPSLKEHLLHKLNRIGDVADKYQDTQDAIADLRRALEALPE